MKNWVLIITKWAIALIAIALLAFCSQCLEYIDGSLLTSVIYVCFSIALWLLLAPSLTLLVIYRYKSDIFSIFYALFLLLWTEYAKFDYFFRKLSIRYVFTLVIISKMAFLSRCVIGFVNDGLFYDFVTTECIWGWSIILLLFGYGLY